jgi:hydroxymethylbilane synthase
MSLLQPAVNKMGKLIRIGTRESQLAVWQATRVKELLAQNGFAAELIYIKSEGDIDLQTPLYEMGVQGIFTKSLDIALLNDKIDIAVHSMKDVPTQLAKGIAQAAILKRASYKDILVLHPDLSKKNAVNTRETRRTIQSGSKIIKEEKITIPLWDHPNIDKFTVVATSSIRRKAQWLNMCPNDKIETLRGNVNTRLRKLHESKWHGAIFAAAGLERINLLPENSIELDWMLPAPAQGAIMVVCRDKDEYSLNACANFNDADTALCTKIERDFLRTLLGGCSTPISALATIKKGRVYFMGNILSLDGKDKAEIEITSLKSQAEEMGAKAAHQLLFNRGGQSIADGIRNATK